MTLLFSSLLLVDDAQVFYDIFTTERKDEIVFRWVKICDEQ